MLGVANFWMGRFGPSRDHLEQAVEQYRPEQRGVHTSLYAQDPKVICLCRLGWTLWYLGRPVAGRRRIEQSLTLARDLEHPHSRAYALYFSAQYFVDVGEVTRADELLDKLIALTDERSAPQFRYRGLITKGWVRADRGEKEAGLAQMRRSIAKYMEPGNVVGVAGNVVGVAQEYCRLAQIEFDRGAIEDASQALSEASAIVEETDEVYREAELHRLESKLLLAEDGNSAAAEACLWGALDVARRQEARSLELRAAMTLGSLLDEEGRTGEARELLQEVFDQFSEGFDTADLERASTLLGDWS